MLFESSVWWWTMVDLRFAFNCFQLLLADDREIYLVLSLGFHENNISNHIQFCFLEHFSDNLANHLTQDCTLILPTDRSVRVLVVCSTICDHLLVDYSHLN